MTLSTPLQDFVRTVEALAARELPLPRLFELLMPEFCRLLAEPDLLTPEQRQPGSGRYTQHALYGCPANRFAMVGLIWRPGESTMIHDHHTWGLAGVYEGCERETRYTLCDREDGETGLRLVGVGEAQAGEVVAIVPPSDIHRVANAASTPTISLHLYGCNVLALPGQSSVRRTFGDELVVGSAEPGLALPA